MDYQFVIPEESPIRKILSKLAKETRVVIFSGLPGVGKSFYINEFYQLVLKMGKSVDLIQWDQARKAFETEEILSQFPMGEGTVHNGLKLIAGEWLLQVISDWIKAHEEDENILLIEAPLVGHRFIELAIPSDDELIESYLSDSKTCFVVPVPSKEVRQKIEDLRAAAVKEDAKEWYGAKPSGMKMLWEMTCDIAAELGKELNAEDPYRYDPLVYEYVFSHVLKHRCFVPLRIEELFDSNNNSDEDMHGITGLLADESEANELAELVINKYKDLDEIDEIVSNWYNT